MAGPYRRVIERFPHHGELVRELVRRSEDFSSLCEDYTLVVETLGDLVTRQPPTSSMIIGEYRRCLLEIELDITDALVIAINHQQP